MCIDLCNIILSWEKDIIDVNPYTIQLFHRVPCGSLDTSQGVYRKAAFMVVFAVAKF